MSSKGQIFLFLAIWLHTVCAFAGQNTIIKEWTVQSPDQRYEMKIYQKQLTNGKKQLYYSLNYRNKPVVEESELGILIENQLFESALGIENDTSTLWCENLDFKEEQVNQIQAEWKPLYGERSNIRDHYNELILRFVKFGAGEEHTEGQHGTAYDKRRSYEMDLVVRAYDEGVAFKYFFPESANGLFLHITGEQTSFSFAEGTKAYYERWAQGPYALKPLAAWEDESERPLTLELKNGLYVALLEAQMVDYARTRFKLTNVNTLRASLYGNVDAVSPFSSSWRVIMAAEEPGELIENNDIVLNLNNPNAIKNTAWIKPGKVIRSGLSTAEAKACIDFAATHHLQYVHLDAGWYGPEMKVSSKANRVAENRDIDMQQLISYAAQNSIGIFVYVNQRALLENLDELFGLYQKWGIKGVKFGFVQIGSNRWSDWLHKAVKKAAEYQLLVDIHDEYRPTGFSRTYPNLLTQEGIRGNEEMPDATHNTILPYTRFLAGAGDYTICYYNNRIKTTHAHQLALSVVYYSPLQFLYWYDNPSHYNGEPEIEFFDKVKTVWDDTRVLQGQIGQYIVTARRSGEEWFVGAITNNDSRKIDLGLNFLEKDKQYVLSSYTDDDEVNTKTKVAVNRFLVDSTTPVQLLLKASGGAAFHIRLAQNADKKNYKSLIKKAIKLR
ncbi:glycoside hydrolase family 97 protein [Olivibacter domesticus]|uniref:Alpha-glucosidase n=1 Tax=Olivibacter domesticus TaxID=407022 RepID=A0A1H7GEB8_OLID1|nr:glycoside hydrolase family 97 protein [Olivibacter domesticus]SEK36593.1 alpha-glucosidase [Olivibacter domesticus]